MCGERLGRSKPGAKPRRRPRNLNCTQLKRRLTNFAMRNLDDLKSLSFWRGVLAEFTACFFLILVGCGSCIETDEYPNTMRVAFAFGFMYSVLIYCLRHISGGHLNPAVSIAMAATCKISIARAVLYVVAQTLGAILGAAVLFGITAEPYRGILGCTVPNKFVTEGQGFGVEFFATFILVFITFACFEDHKEDEERRFPGHLVIGLTVAALLCFAEPLTGGSFNAARSFGPAVVKGIWTNHWIYWFGTIIGGGIGGIIYDIGFSKSATLKELISCMAGTGQPYKEPAAPVQTAKETATETERQALRAKDADKASRESFQDIELEEQDESGEEAPKATAQMC